jgi:hypothetical protein
MITNFLIDIFFIDAINMMPISVGRGEAIIKLAKAASKYTLTESGIHLLTVRTTVSFESFCTSSLKPFDKKEDNSITYQSANSS